MSGLNSIPIQYTWYNTVHGFERRKGVRVVGRAPREFAVVYAWAGDSAKTLFRSVAARGASSVGLWIAYTYNKQQQHCAGPLHLLIIIQFAVRTAVTRARRYRVIIISHRYYITIRGLDRKTARKPTPDNDIVYDSGGWPCSSPFVFTLLHRHGPSTLRPSRYCTFKFRVVQPLYLVTKIGHRSLERTWMIFGVHDCLIIIVRTNVYYLYDFMKSRGSLVRGN